MSRPPWWVGPTRSGARYQWGTWRCLVLGEDELIEHCRERLAKYKVPRAVTVIAALPRNPSGKVLKRELRERG